MRLRSAWSEICPKCRAPNFHVISNRPMQEFAWAGKSWDTWKCDACGHTVESPHTR